MAALSSASEKNVRWRSAARISRSTTCTPASTLAFLQVTDCMAARHGDGGVRDHPRFHRSAGRSSRGDAPPELGEDRLMYFDGQGRLRSILTSWTSLAAADAFAQASGGRSWFRPDDLLRLAPCWASWLPARPMTLSRRLRRRCKVRHAAAAVVAPRPAEPVVINCGIKTGLRVEWPARLALYTTPRAAYKRLRPSRRERPHGQAGPEGRPPPARGR